MLKELTSSEWNAWVEQQPWVPIQANVNFIELIASVYHVNPHYYLVEYKETYTAAFAVFVKGNKIVLPTHFFYSAFFINPDLKNSVINKSLRTAIYELKKRYTSIQLKLPPEFTDIRIFQWNGFKINILYTFYKVLNELNDYSENLRRNLKKIENENLETKVNSTEEYSLKRNLRQAQSYGMSVKAIKLLSQLVSGMSAKNMLTEFTIFKEDENIASAFLFHDARRAYLMMINSDEKWGDLNPQTKLYHDFFTYFQSKQLVEVDLLGANIPSVSEFKSKFNVKLMPYYYVEYQKFETIHNIKNYFKKKLKKVLKK